MAAKTTYIVYHAFGKRYKKEKNSRNFYYENA